MRKHLVGFVVLVSAIGGIGCVSESLGPDGERGDSVERSASSTEALNAASKPVDATPVAMGAASQRKVTAGNLQKAPPLRKATQDEIEVLNETFQTDGSREIIRRRIEKANGQDRQRLVGYYNTVVLSRLAPAEQKDAQLKLAATLARVQSTAP